MDKRIGDVRHFKLASGDEVICEVIEWNDPYSDDATRQEEIVIRKAVKMVYAKSTLVFLFIRCVRLWYIKKVLVVLSR